MPYPGDSRARSSLVFAATLLTAPHMQPISARPNRAANLRPPLPLGRPQPPAPAGLAWPGPPPRAATGAPSMLSALGPVAGEVNYSRKGACFGGSSKSGLPRLHW